MAETDFSNATFEPYGNKNNINYAYLSLRVPLLVDSNGNTVSRPTITIIEDETKQFVLEFTGTFERTEDYFIIRNDINRQWIVRSVYYNSGDTYTFRIKADLICN